MALYYLDSSACLKLFKEEEESTAFANWLSSLSSEDVIASSDLMKTEVVRAVNRYLPQQRELVSEFLKSVVTLRISNQVLQTATSLQPTELGTLDAIHLASATAVCSENDFFVSYDQRLLVAAARQGLQTLSPAN